MGTGRNGGRTLAGFFGLSFGLLLLFGLVAVAALRPTDGLAWVQVPALSPDLGLDPGLRTKPLKQNVVAEAVRDSALQGMDSLAVSPVLRFVPPTATGIGSPAPSESRPVVAPSPSASPLATPSPSVAPSPTPTVAPTPLPSPSPVPTASPTPNPTPMPTPTPTPKPAFALVFTNEVVAHFPNTSKTKCSASTVTAFGSFKTNGVGGWVSYKYVRIDSKGNRTDVLEAPIWVAPGDTNLHLTVADSWTPKTSGSEQLVFLSPTSVTATGQSWTCAP